MTYFCVSYLSGRFPIVLQSYVDFIWHGLIVSICVAVLYALIYLVTQFTLVHDLAEGALHRLRGWLSR